MTAPARLPVFVGIDLGSTTTKALVLEAAGRILGRGITNSRSNYDVACQVARHEALLQARLALVRRGLERDGRAAPAAETGIDALERGLRLEQHLAQLERLRAALEDTAAAPRHFAYQTELRRRTGGIVDAMAERAPALYAPGAARKSDFFRDLASAEYMTLAATAADAKIPFEILCGAYDAAILPVENSPQDASFERHAPSALERAVLAAGVAGAAQVAALRAAVETARTTVLDEVGSVGTGYGRTRLPFPKAQIRSEILCHGLGAHEMFPASATVLDIGGQDTKAIQVDARGIVTSFQMNDRCAAGCGRYLGYIADEMNLGLHELGPLAQQATRRVKISSTCTVFAGAELRDRLSMGERREDILAGLHRAIMLRAMSLLARSGGVQDEFTFTGGVAKNPAAVAALHELVEQNYGRRTINISPESIYTGALGAALFALRGEAVRPADGRAEEPSRGRA